MRFRAFFALFVLTIVAQAQPAYQVRDISQSGSSPSQGPPGSRPHQLTPTQGKLFFRAGSDANYEGEIWATDGTPGGTLRVSGDCLEDGCNPEGPQLVGSLRNLAFWVAPVLGGSLLWRSDGTWSGTFPLNDWELLRVPDPRRSDLPSYVPLGGFLYFQGCADSDSSDPGCELWRTDGSREGTRLVADVNPGAEHSHPSWLTAVGNRLFFVATTGTGVNTDAALWVSNGTAAGTALVRKFAHDPDSIRSLETAGGKLFFIAQDGANGEELWVSDGTAAGTRTVTRFTPENPFGMMKPLGSDLYFLADDVEHGVELWRSDGTAAGTVRVTELGYHRPFSGEREPILESQIAAAGHRVVFLATDGLNGFEYWSTSGTPESTTRVADPCPASDCTDVQDNPDPSLILATVGDRVVLRMYDEHHDDTAWSTDGTPGGTVRLLDADLQSRPFAIGRSVFFFAGADLWRTDGTPAGTRRYADLSLPNFPPFDPQEIASHKGRIYFNVTSPAYGEELWSSDGRPGGTGLVADVFPSPRPGSSPHGLTAFGDRLLFFAFQNGTASLWQSAGTAASTTALGFPLTATSSCSTTLFPTLVRVGAKAFFLRQDAACQVSLWVTDGTAAGTVQLPGNVLQASLLDPPTMIEHQGRLWFLAREGNETTIWKSDGTPAGTGRALDLPAGSSGPYYLTSLGPDLYFVATEPEGHRQVWKSDGTTAGTARVTAFDDEELSLAADPQLTRVGSTVFFRTEATFFGGGLWATGGTLASTREVLPPVFEGDAGGARGLTGFQGKLYFFLEDGESGTAPWALWRSDGTADGTVRVAGLGFQDADLPIEPTIVGDELFFVFGSPGFGRELWKMDGAGDTGIVLDVLPGEGSSHPTGLKAAGGKLYFRADDGLHGVEPWESDGTAAGTRRVHDINPLSGSSHPGGFTEVGGLLFFGADDGVTGRELWALPLAGSGACQPSPTHLCLSGGRFRVEANWKDFSGNTGQGQAVALTPDTGYFWFFDENNVEVIAKVLDGRGVNAHHWVFYGALSNVEYSITVTDTQTGLTRRYFNPSGRFASVGDTTGFGPSWNRAEDAAFVAPAAAAPLVSEHTDLNAKAPCAASTTRLCLNNNRFAVEVTWKDFSGNTGTGKAVSLTGDTGYFWFFDDDNVELVLKVLDGRPVNHKFWVFYGALSSVEYTITVTDTETGAVKTYRNPSGRLGSVGDTGAF